MNSGESTSQLVPCTGVVSCVQCSPYEHCSSLLCYASHVSTDAGQTTHHIGIAQTHPKEVCFPSILMNYSCQHFTAIA